MIRAGEIEVAVAGGMESMTNAPYVLPKARDGSRLGKYADLSQHEHANRTIATLGHAARTMRAPSRARTVPAC
jgi:acetyl-CoA acetyltransferase